MSGAPLPQLLDTKALCTELGVKRAVAEHIIRRLPKQQIPGCRRLFVRRDHVYQLRNRMNTSNVSKRFEKPTVVCCSGNAA